MHAHHRRASAYAYDIETLRQRMRVYVHNEFVSEQMKITGEYHLRVFRQRLHDAHDAIDAMDWRKHTEREIASLADDVQRLADETQSDVQGWRDYLESRHGPGIIAELDKRKPFHDGYPDPIDCTKWSSNPATAYKAIAQWSKQAWRKVKPGDPWPDFNDPETGLLAVAKKKKIRPSALLAAVPKYNDDQYLAGLAAEAKRQGIALDIDQEREILNSERPSLVAPAFEFPPGSEIDRLIQGSRGLRFDILTTESQSVFAPFLPERFEVVVELRMRQI